MSLRVPRPALATYPSWSELTPLTPGRPPSTVFCGIASLAGMTFELFNGFKKHDRSLLLEPLDSEPSGQALKIVEESTVQRNAVRGALPPCRMTLLAWESNVLYPRHPF
jgi:hypothetical protein